MMGKSPAPVSVRFLIVIALTATFILIGGGQAHSPCKPGPPDNIVDKPSSVAIKPDPEVELLAAIIYNEARGECFSGQVAVGAVIMNRVADERFPETVQDVIRQPGQFVPVGRSLSDAGVTARKAALEALSGHDPTGGALYFYNPGLATSEWIFTRPVVCTIGQHRFAR